MAITTDRQMYEFRLGGWNGVPDGPDALYGYSMYPYLNRAWRSLGHKSDCPDGMTDLDLMQGIIGAIEPDQHGVYPVIEAVPTED